MIKMDIVFHYEVDEQTGEIKYIGKEELKVDTVTTKVTKTTKSNKIDNSAEPLVTLEPNKLVLTQGAVELLKVSADSRIDIKYKKKNKEALPIIGSDEAFGTKGGNKLSKSNTVSYRGAANEKLSAFGNIFKLAPTEDEGIFYLIGNAEPKESNPIPKELVNIEKELDSLNDLDSIDIEDSKDLGSFDFRL